MINHALGCFSLHPLSSDLASTTDLRPVGNPEKCRMHLQTSIKDTCPYFLCQISHMEYDYSVEGFRLKLPSNNMGVIVGMRGIEPLL